jgi:hypothetical protein
MVYRLSELQLAAKEPSRLYFRRAAQKSFCQMMASERNGAGLLIDQAAEVECWSTLNCANESVRQPIGLHTKRSQFGD